jgi:hypothetical protein
LHRWRLASNASTIGPQAKTPSVDVGGAKARRADAEQRLRRHLTSIAAGVEPAALVETINQAQAERSAAQAEIDRRMAETTIHIRRAGVS